MNQCSNSLVSETPNFRAYDGSSHVCLVCRQNSSDVGGIVWASAWNPNDDNNHSLTVIIFSCFREKEQFTWRHLPFGSVHLRQSLAFSAPEDRSFRFSHHLHNSEGIDWWWIGGFWSPPRTWNVRRSFLLSFPREFRISGSICFLARFHRFEEIKYPERVPFCFRSRPNSSCP